MPKQTTISIIGRDSQPIQSKGLYNQTLFKQRALSIDVLRTNLSAFIESMSAIFDQTTASINNYELNEIEVNVDVSVTGGVSLIGSVDAGAAGGITLKFKRKQTNE